MMRRFLWLTVLLVFAASLAPSLALAKKPVSDKGKILFVPHDNRPISDEQTADNIKRIGWEIETPPDDILGSRDRLGNPETVWNWLEEHAKTADIAVLSSDTLIYGSLVGSRKHDYSEKKLLERVERFYTDYLEPRKIAPVWEQIEGKEIVLVSQTMDLIARTVTRHIGAKAYYATQHKEEVLAHYTDFDIITDNLSDIELIKHAKHATIITYNNQARWKKILPKGINVTFIETGREKY